MKCQHVGCSCEGGAVERNGREYCGEHCAQADANGHTAPACGCDHDECRGLAPA